ncbi:glutamate 5-kinase [Natranaerofaba carboxydovora]|uniref:glutamate 5-kinase n=1 Tax=Natranaerofaba carboxydovora TaxID=2742683 RepID=UPI001F141343|nr:glutamate 5-kinase [Natranaerofaba carboxydovora]UMZ74080.1 Glutamate 5-kinase [Natranaerofaba carboxydovora]
MTNRNLNLTENSIIVFKVGTSTITYPNGKLNLNYCDKLVRQLSDLANQGIKVILVASGAVGAGLGKLNFQKKPETTSEKQALAAVGQGVLIQHFEKLFSEYGHTIAQILLTRDDIANRKSYLYARKTLATLLSYGVIPIINENDTVATDEIEFGDNDTLSALVASTVDANLLVLLSDIEGLYTKDPYKHPDAKFISEVKKITPDIESLCGISHDKRGTGGMVSKIQAAKIATSSGVPMIITQGNCPEIIQDIIEYKSVGTLFHPAKKTLNCRRRWIAFAEFSQGKIYVDEGAKEAICTLNKSLLPSGIKMVAGSFERYKVVSICDEAGNIIGKGISNYSSREIHKIKGLQSKEISATLGYSLGSEVMHRDNFVIFENEEVV